MTGTGCVRYQWAKVGAQDRRRPLGHYPLVDTISTPSCSPTIKVVTKISNEILHFAKPKRSFDLPAVVHVFETCGCRCQDVGPDMHVGQHSKLSLWR